MSTKKASTKGKTAKAAKAASVKIIEKMTQAPAEYQQAAASLSNAYQGVIAARQTVMGYVADLWLMEQLGHYQVKRTVLSEATGVPTSTLSAYLKVAETLNRFNPTTIHKVAKGFLENKKRAEAPSQVKKPDPNKVVERMKSESVQGLLKETTAFRKAISGLPGDRQRPGSAPVETHAERNRRLAAAAASARASGEGMISAVVDLINRVKTGWDKLTPSERKSMALQVRGLYNLVSAKMEK